MTSPRASMRCTRVPPCESPQGLGRGVGLLNANSPALRRGTLLSHHLNSLARGSLASICSTSSLAMIRYRQSGRHSSTVNSRSEPQRMRSAVRSLSRPGHPQQRCVGARRNGAIVRSKAMLVHVYRPSRVASSAKPPLLVLLHGEPRPARCRRPSCVPSAVGTSTPDAGGARVSCLHCVTSTRDGVACHACEDSTTRGRSVRMTSGAPL